METDGDADATDVIRLIHALRARDAARVRGLALGAVERLLSGSGIAEVPELVDDVLALLNETGAKDAVGARTDAALECRLRLAQTQAVAETDARDTGLLDVANAALDAAERSADAGLRRQALGGLARSLCDAGHLPRAQELGATLLREAEEARDLLQQGVALGVLATTAARTGRMADALDLHERELLLARTMGRRDLEGHAWVEVGNSRLEVRPPAESEAAYAAALRIAEELGDAALRAAALEGLGRLWADMPGRAGEAHAALEEAVSHAVHTGQRSLEAKRLNHTRQPTPSREICAGVVSVSSACCISRERCGIATRRPSRS